MGAASYREAVFSSPQLRMRTLAAAGDGLFTHPRKRVASEHERGRFSPPHSIAAIIQAEAIHPSLRKQTLHGWQEEGLRALRLLQRRGQALAVLKREIIDGPQHERRAQVQRGTSLLGQPGRPERPRL